MKNLKNKLKRSKFEITPFIFLRNSLTNLIEKQKHAITVPHTKYRKHLLAPRGLLFGTSRTTTWYQSQLLFCSINCGAQNSGHVQLKQNVLH
jgi:hypothetical protein